MKLRRLIPFLVLVVFPLTLPAQQGASTNPLQVSDFLNLESVGSPQISPDGSQIVYTRRWVNAVEDSWESALWIMNADGSRNRFLTKGSNAQWSPDGTRILYLASGEPGGSQIFVRWMDAEGATSQVTHVEHSPVSPSWSPDGTMIAFASVVPASSTWNIDMPARPEGATWTPAPRIVDRLHYRQDRRGDGFMDPGFSHLFVVTADGGTPRQLTDGEWNVGARFDALFRGVGYDWTPDGAEIVFDGLMDTDGDDAYRRSAIYAINVATKAIRPITSTPGTWTNPAVSPDGQTVAYTGYPENPGGGYNQGDLYAVSIDGSGARNLMGDFDRPISSDLHWSPDNRGVYFSSADQGSVNIRYGSLRDGVSEVTSGQQVLSLSSVARDRNRTAVGTASDPAHPADVVSISLRRPGDLSRLTNVNHDVLGERDIGEVEEIWYTSSGGARIQGWIIKPPGFDENARYPLIMEIHGGPFSMYNVGFNFMRQALAAPGNVVLFTNPRGSTGYGEEFSQQINFRYPGVDYDDLMAGVDEVISRGFIDTTRMYVGGCSGGGVLSSWVIGHTTRFAGAAVRCPVTNWMSMAGQTDIPLFTHSFFEEPFWENPDRWLEQSSMMYVGNVTTPTIVMTGVLDKRTPMPQSEEFFAALKMRDIPTRLLRFNGEFHGTSSKPSNAMRTILYMLDWYEQHQRGGEMPGEESVTSED